MSTLQKMRLLGLFEVINLRGQEPPKFNVNYAINETCLVPQNSIDIVQNKYQANYTRLDIPSPSYMFICSSSGMSQRNVSRFRVREVSLTSATCRRVRSPGILCISESSSETTTAAIAATTTKNLDLTAFYSTLITIRQ